MRKGACKPIKTADKHDLGVLKYIVSVLSSRSIHSHALSHFLLPISNKICCPLYGRRKNRCLLFGGVCKTNQSEQFKSCCLLCGGTYKTSRLRVAICKKCCLLCGSENKPHYLAAFIQKKNLYCSVSNNRTLLNTKQITEKEIFEILETFNLYFREN